MLGNLDVVRDWGYAPRYVEAMWLTLQQEAPSDYIICSGGHCSLREYVATVFTRLGLDVDALVRCDPELYRAVDLAEMYGDNRKSKEALAWSYDLSTEQLIDQLIKDEREFRAWKDNASMADSA